MSDKDPDVRRAYKTQWQKQDYTKNPDKYRDAQVRFRERNPAAAAAIMKRHRELHKDAIATRRKAQYDPDKARHDNAAQYRKHQVKRRASALARRDANLEAARQRKRDWDAANPQVNTYYASVRRARQRRLQWTNLEAVKAIYLACPVYMVVDHIVPLKGFTVEGYPVTGLHVEWNLQYLTDAENASKHNRMRPEDGIRYTE
jgi:5-methylcytosine-specific restriction endonuclease McrA